MGKGREGAVSDFDTAVSVSVSVSQFLMLHLAVLRYGTRFIGLDSLLLRERGETGKKDKELSALSACAGIREKERRERKKEISEGGKKKNHST